MKIEGCLKYLSPIDEIGIGECFIYENSLCMRVNNKYLDPSVNKDFPYAILNLETSCLNAVKNEYVRRVKAKIVIE